MKKSRIFTESNREDEAHRVRHEIYLLAGNPRPDLIGPRWAELCDELRKLTNDSPMREVDLRHLRKVLFLTIKFARERAVSEMGNDTAAPPPPPPAPPAATAPEPAPEKPNPSISPADVFEVFGLGLVRLAGMLRHEEEAPARLARFKLFRDAILGVDLAAEPSTDQAGLSSDTLGAIKAHLFPPKAQKPGEPSPQRNPDTGPRPASFPGSRASKK